MPCSATQLHSSCSNAEGAQRHYFISYMSVGIRHHYLCANNTEGVQHCSDTVLAVSRSMVCGYIQEMGQLIPFFGRKTSLVVSLSQTSGVYLSPLTTPTCRVAQIIGSDTVRYQLQWPILSFDNVTKCYQYPQLYSDVKIVFKSTNVRTEEYQLQWLVLSFGNVTRCYQYPNFVVMGKILFSYKRA